MNASQFMDKQIMDLTSSSPPRQPGSGGGDFIDLMNHYPDDDRQSNLHGVVGGNGIKKEEIFPSYDFHPIRPTVSAANLDISATGSSNVAALRGLSSADSRSNSDATSAFRNYGSLESIEPAKVRIEKDQDAFDSSIVSEIDRTMKKYADNLLHALDGVSARLTQLETRSRHLESSVDDLKVSVGNNYGSTDGKMRQLENILREVQTGVQVLKDKQELVGAQLQLAKLQVSKADQQQSETQNTGQTDTVQQAASAPPQSHQQLLPPANFPQQIPLVPIPPPAMPPPSIPQQNLPPPAPLPNQFPPHQIPPVPQREPYYPPPSQTQEPPLQLPQPSAAPLNQPYQPAPQPPYSQPSQPQPSLGHHTEDASYISTHGYLPNLRQQSSQPPTGAPPSQQYYGAPPHVYEPPSSRPSSGFTSGYGPSSGPPEPYPYSGTSSQLVSSPKMRPQQLPPPAIPQVGGSGYPQLPTARILPQSLPTATAVSGGSGSSGTGNRVPIDDVVDKVTSMGFPREHVRATVRKLTENGQSVDLNVVLDKLMNDGEIQPPRGWFGR